MTEKTIWGVHMSRDHGLTPIEQGYVAIGWDEMGDFSAIKPTREAFKAAYARTYPNAKPGAVPVSAGVAYRFAVEMKPGDIIIFPSKPDRMVNIGVVESGYRYVKGAPVNCRNQRSVKWLKQIPRASFSQSALNEIGSAIAMFRVSSNAGEFLAALEGQALQPEDIDEVSAERVSAQVEESTEDFIIKRLKTSQTAYQFEHFIAHLLKLASIPGSILMLASSPYAKRGELYAAYRRHFGKDDARVLVWKADTATMNPKIDPAIIAEAYESDPEAGKAEYGAEFRSDIADFVTREIIDAVTCGRHELPPEPGVTYAGFVDPSGGISDSMTLAVAHLRDGGICGPCHFGGGLAVTDL
jgi:predicted Mrr-cat superfamily restriction endonuclease